MELRFCRIESPLGTLLPVTLDGPMIGLMWSERRHGTEAHLRRHLPPHALIEVADIPELTGPLHDYLHGDLDALDAIEVALVGTPFQRKVWSALRTIPRGSTWSYRQLAEAIGCPTAFRAVARANGANPIPLVIPCHRVIAADGGLGGFSCGLDRKRWLLTHEHAWTAAA